MPDSRSGSGKARSKEEEYFLRAEAELLEKVRARVAKEAERRALGEYHGVEDQELLTAFEEAGYDRDTVQILHLVPILQVAWVDGEISAAERAEILKIAAARHVAEGSPAHGKLLAWLETPPSPEFFERTMKIITRLLELFPQEKREQMQSDVLSASLAVASASGGFLGFGSKVSADEKYLLEKFAADFEKARKAALERDAKKS
jgi:tellurite resistance protein